MNFRLLFTSEARDQLNELAADPSRSKRFKAVRKCLALLETNLRHPGLKTHKYDALMGPGQQDIFEAYAENMTPGAYRVFWHYGPAKGQITVYAITPHP